jgi:hypothetical protein
MTEQLPEGVLARIDVTDAGVRVNLSQAMPRSMFAELLRTIADAFDEGTIERVDKEVSS